MYNNQNNSIMKKQNYLWSVLTFIMVAILSFGFMSCGGKDNDDPEPAPVNNKPTLSVEKTSITLDSSNSSSEVTVNVENTGWSVNVTNGSDWLSANKNGNKVSISAKDNTDSGERKGTILVTATEDENLTSTISVTQKGSDAYITVNGTSSAEHTFPGIFDSGKSGIDYKQVFKIKSNVVWTLSGKVEWLNVSATSGNGEVDLSIYPTNVNNSDEKRVSEITLSGSGATVKINIIQEAGLSACYVLPANEVALYDRFCWEYMATSNVNTFQYILLSENEYNRMTDNELLEKIKKEEELKYVNDYLSMIGYDSNDKRIAPNSTYYFVSLACDKDGKYGALKKMKMKTPEFLDADKDAYVTFSNFDNNSNQFQFEAHKEGFCNTYHIIYGVFNESLNSAVFAFEINYYIKNKKKHWLAKNDYYEWEIITDYPNNHTFSYSSSLMAYFPICFGYGWGVFSDGRLSSDLLGFQKDTSNSKSLNRASYNNVPPKNTIIKKSEYLKRIKALQK